MDKTKKNGKRFVFGKAARNIGMLKSSGIPGPGYYTNNNMYNPNRKNLGYSFGKSARIDNIKKGYNLGPGSYNVKNNTFRTQFGFIGKNKRGLNKAVKSTPGYYDVPVTVPNLSMYHYAQNVKK